MPRMELRIREVDKGGEGNEYARGGPLRQAQGPVSLYKVTKASGAALRQAQGPVFHMWYGPSTSSGAGFPYVVRPFGKLRGRFSICGAALRQAQGPV